MRAARGLQPEYSYLSQFVENVVVYIVSFVVRTLVRKTDCKMCCPVLKCSNTIAESQSNFWLLDLKDCGGLVRPSANVVAVCKVAEWKVCAHGPMLGRGPRPLIVSFRGNSL